SRARRPSCASCEDSRCLCAVARRSARAAFPPGLCSGSEPGRVRLEPPAPERRHQEATQTERAAQGPCRERSRSNQEQSMPSPFVLSCRQCRVYYGLGSNTDAGHHVLHSCDPRHSSTAWPHSFVGSAFGLASVADVEATVWSATFTMWASCDSEDSARSHREPESAWHCTACR